MRWPWSRRSDPAGLLTAGDDVAKAATGSGGFTPGPVPGPTKPAGADGVGIYGGFIVTGERDRRLQSTEKWVTFSNQELNVPIIAAAINIWTALGGSAKWTVEPNPRGGKDAERAAQIVREGLVEAQLSKPWQQVVRRQLMKKFRGFALHEVVIRRRDDGMVVVGDLLDRPQHTVVRWNKPDEQSAWVGVEQRTRSGFTAYVPRERLFYSVENTLGASPEGVGLLRQTAEPARVLELYRLWEGIGLQTDLRGIPKARGPLSKLRKNAELNGAKTETEINAYVQASARFLTDFLLGHNKRADQGIFLDSATYTSNDAGGTSGSVTSVNEWDFELVQGGSTSVPEVGAAIGREVRDIARIMSAEWMLLGDAGSGSDAMHEDKTAMFGLVANSALDDIAADAERDVAARLLRLNGLDPETCNPDLRHEPVMRGAVADAARSLQLLFMSGITKKDPALDIMRARMDLPPAPEIDETEMMLPRGVQVDPVTGGEPDPTEQGAAPGADPGQAGNVNARPGQAAPGAKP